MFKNRYNAAKSVIASGALTVVSGLVMAQEAGGPDFSGMTGQIDWSTAIAALLLIAGGLAGVYVVNKGIDLILGRLNRKS